MSILILININTIDMKKHVLICLFISMLVSNERGEIVIIKIRDNYFLKRSEIVIRKEMR
jgi:hypothetical protein